MNKQTIQRLTLHHTEVLTDGVPSTVRAREHQSYHLSHLGYSDIAYHFMVDRFGNVLQGRDPDFEGETETSYDTTGHLLVCCEGDYDHERPSAVMLDAVGSLFAWASQRYDVPTSTIRGHRDYAPGEKTCPGKYLEREVRNGHLAKLAQRIADTRDVQLAYLSPRASRRAVVEIEAATEPS